MPGRRKIADKQILENLRFVAKEIGHVPTIDEFEKNPLSICKESTINRHFKRYSNALKCAGLPTTHWTRWKDYISPITKEQIIQSLQKITASLGHSPTVVEYNTSFLKICSVSYLLRHFGSYNNALQAAGLTAYMINKKRRNKYTKSMIINNAKKFIKNSGHLPTMRELISHKKYGVSQRALIKYFKSMDNFLNELGYTNEQVYQNRYKDVFSNETLLSDLFHTALKYPTEHSLYKLIRLSKHSGLIYKKRFKSSVQVLKLLRQKYGLIIYENRIQCEHEKSHNKQKKENKTVWHYNLGG